ncbi:MAG: S53 family peptidase, partial [Solirubrobacteraceae bacterium]
LGSAPAGQKISLVLPLRADEAGLERLATAVSTPGSAQYGHYESIATLSRRFGASPAARARTLSYLRSAGASGVKIDATGLFADATMPVALAQRMFKTPLAKFGQAGAASFVAPGGAARLPAALSGAVTGVVGIDTRPLVASANVAGRGASVPADAAWTRKAGAPAGSSGPGIAHSYVSGYTSRTGSAAGCSAATSGPGFTPNQYLTAYGYAPLRAAGIQGQGERVALIEIDGFRYSDVRTFSKCFGLATPAINSFGVGVSRSLAPGGESTLDLEVLDSAAPKLKSVDVYETHTAASDVLRALTAPLQNPGRKPEVISASLGACESETLDSLGVSGVRSVEGSLALAAASGISVLSASGDAGSSACVTDSGEPYPQLAVSYPASSPFVTAVGGTNVALSSANSLTGQVVWNDAPAAVVAGGGGVSALFHRPSYQKGFVVPNRRVLPDVSMLADPYPGYEIYCSVRGPCTDKRNPDPWSTVGGTSASSPLMAGGLALVDQVLRIHGRQDVGLANPLLYAVDHSASGRAVISDVVAGGNDLGPSLDGKPLGCCTAHAGFDYASGLGSVNLAALASAAQTMVPAIVNVGLSLPGQRHPVASRHLLARVTCSGACLLGAYARIAVGRSKRLITAASNISVLKGKGARTIKIGLSGSGLKRLRGAVAHHDRVIATVYGAIVDPGGDVERHTPGKTLHITR